MLLRRVTKHVKDQNWFAVFIDFLIVVVGVFIGIQVNNWNQARIDRQDEALFYEDLHQDIVNVQVISSRLLNRRQERFDQLGELVDVLDGSATKRDLVVDDCSALVYSDVYYVGRASLPALTQLRDAGRTGIINNRALQKALAGLSQSEESLGTVLNSIGNKTHDLRKKYSEYFSIGSGTIPDASRPGEFEREPVIIDCDVDSIFEKKEVMSSLALNLEFYDAFMRDGLRPWSEQVDAVHQQLDSLLKIKHADSGDK